MILKNALVFIISICSIHHAYADLILYPTADMETRERSQSSGGPIVVNGNLNVVVNHSWRGLVYYKFDLSLVSDLSAVTSATLGAYELPTGQSGSNFGNADDIIDLYYTQDHSWTETSDWYDVPWHTNVLIDRAYHYDDASTWLTWNISDSDLVSAVSEDTLSLVLQNTQQSSWNHTALASRENADVALRPYLILEGNVFLVPEPATAVLLFSLALLVPFRIAFPQHRRSSTSNQ